MALVQLCLDSSQSTLRFETVREVLLGKQRKNTPSLAPTGRGDRGTTTRHGVLLAGVMFVPGCPQKINIGCGYASRCVACAIVGHLLCCVLWLCLVLLSAVMSTDRNTGCSAAWTVGRRPTSRGRCCGDVWRCMVCVIVVCCPVCAHVWGCHYVLSVSWCVVSCACRRVMR